MPRLFFRVKALTASRLDDICSLPSRALTDGGIVFPADISKHRNERFAKLPEDVYTELLAYRGPKWVWEKYPAELKVATQKLGVPCHRLNPEFSPRRLYLWVVQIMQAYQKDTGKDFSSHDFRKAAFTRAAEKDMHPKKVASGFGVTAETMLRYYTAVDQRKASEEVGVELADDLDPTK
jgi:integrase